VTPATTRAADLAQGKPVTVDARADVDQVLDTMTQNQILTKRPDVDLVHSLLLGPVFCWIILAHNPVKRGLTARIADHVAGALQAASARK